MKRYYAIAAASLLTLSACNPGNEYDIRGHISGDADFLRKGNAYLIGIGKEFADTTAIKDGSFRFRGRNISPGYYSITVRGIKGNMKLFVENDRYSIEASKDDLKHATIKGGETQELYNKLDARRDEMLTNEQYSALSREAGNPRTSPERKEEINAQIWDAREKLREYERGLALGNPSSFFTLNYLESRMSDMPYEELKELARPFREKSFLDSDVARSVIAYVDNEALLQPSGMAPQISLPGASKNEMVDFASVYSSNKVTLIHFWGSFLKTSARQEELWDLYGAYHGKGLEIICVSLDRKSHDWKSFLSANPLPGIQASDLKFWESEAATTFNIRYVPQNILVGNDGRIIARRLMIKEDLDRQLSSIL